MFGTKILEERKSEFNGNLQVVRSFGLGTYIQAKNLTQSGGIVESIWKPTLKHVSNIKYPISNILILGLGGGTVANLVRKNWPEAEITGVDIDPDMVELGEKYLGLDKNNVKIKITDAQNFLTSRQSQVTNHFDLVIVDLYQGDKFPKKFETTTFLRVTRGTLVKGGLVIFNRLYYGNKKVEAEKFGQKLQKVFSNVEYYYPVTNLMFLCSK